MMGKRGGQANKRKLTSYPWYFYVILYYFSLNSVLSASVIMYIVDFNDWRAIFDGLLLFKFLFCILSAAFLERVISNRRFNTFGKGYVYLCGVYFFLFTLNTYLVIGYKIWISNSTDKILPNLLSIIDSLLSEAKMKLPAAYYGSYIFVVALVLPTPVLGAYMVKEMFDEYLHPTVIVLASENTMIAQNFAQQPKKKGGKKKKN